jgi:hypothetical protein
MLSCSYPDADPVDQCDMLSSGCQTVVSPDVVRGFRSYILVDHGFSRCNVDNDTSVPKRRPSHQYLSHVTRESCLVAQMPELELEQREVYQRH